MRRALALTGFGALAIACSSSAPPAPAGPDFGAPSATYPAFAPRAPAALALGGPVMSAPRIVPVFFAGHPYQTEMVDFLQKFLGSATAKAMTSEYGAGQGTLAPAVSIATPLPAVLSQDEVVQWLKSELDGTHPELGAVDAATRKTTLYLLFYPEGTTITISGGAFPSCRTFRGFHDDAGGDTIYAVIPFCTSSSGRSVLDGLTSVTSHEIVEALTDPLPSSLPAFGDVDQADVAWSISGFGGEIGDLCEAFVSSAYRPPDLGYLIQRSWSNARAAQHRDPCVPVPSSAPAYFNSAPIADELVDVFFGGGHRPARGINIAIGETKTVEVQLFSDAPTEGPWTVSAFVVLVASDGTILPKVLDVSLDGEGGMNGNKLHLSITAKGKTPLGASFVRLDSRLGDQTHSWFLTVGS